MAPKNSATVDETYVPPEPPRFAPEAPEVPPEEPGTKSPTGGLSGARFDAYGADARGSQQYSLDFNPQSSSQFKLDFTPPESAQHRIDLRPQQSLQRDLEFLMTMGFENGKNVRRDLKIVESDGSWVGMDPTRGNRITGIDFAGGKKTAELSYSDDQARKPNRIDMEERSDNGATNTTSFRQNDTGKWELYLNDRFVTQLPGDVRVSGDGITYETGDGFWHTERRDGSVVTEKELLSGARVALDGDKGVQLVSRSDNTRVEVATIAGSKTITEIDAAGKRVNWHENNGEWTSAERPGETRREMELGKNGVLSYISGDTRHQILPGGGDITGPAGEASRAVLDEHGRLSTITYPNGDVRSIVYAQDSNQIASMSYKQAKTGETHVYTRVGNEEKFSYTYTNAQGRVTKRGTWNGSIDARLDGSFAVLDGAGNRRKPSGFWQVSPPNGQTYMERKNADGSVLRTDTKFNVKSLNRPDDTSIECKRQNDQLVEVSEKRRNGETVTFKYDAATKMWTASDSKIEPSKTPPVDASGNLSYKTVDGSTHNIGTSGRETVVTRDGATISLSKSGEPEKITQRNGDYRVIHREGDKVTGFTDYSKAGTEKRSVKDVSDLSLSQNGDIRYKDQKGNLVIEKASFNKIEHNERGQVSKVMRPDGSYREIIYDDKTHEASKIRDVTIHSKGQRVDEWERTRGANGAYTDTFARTRAKDSKVLEVRKNVKFDESGDYGYSDSKDRQRESRVADRFRRDGEGISSATVEEAHYNFLDEMRMNMPDELRLERLEKMMNGFERRMSEQVELRVAGGMTQEQAEEEIERKVADTYDHMTRMVQADTPDAIDDKKTRVMLAETFMYHAWEPEFTNQSGWGSCWLQSGYVPCGLGKHPESMAKVVADVSTTGSYRDTKGNTYEFNRDQLGIHEWRDGAGWSINTASNDKSQPSPIAHRLDRTLSVMDRGARYGGAGNHGRIRYGGGGQNEIMRRVTGDELLYIDNGYPANRNQRLALVRATASQKDGGWKHVNTVALRKFGDHWGLVHGDQYDGRDKVVAVIRDLKEWVETGRTARINRSFQPELGKEYNIADSVKPSDFKPGRDRPFRNRDDDDNPRPGPIIAWFRRRRR